MTKTIVVHLTEKEQREILERQRKASEQQRRDRSKPSRETLNGRLTRFGLTKDEIEALGKDLKCSACERLDVVVDHDHTTGKFRGLLCSRCNYALGMLQDNPDTISKLLAYLVTSKSNS